MALTTIAYGSVASSQVMNNNFSYLDGRITTVNSTINTSISSILSNIATINSRLTELAGDLEDAVTEIESDLAEFKQKAQIAVTNINMSPKWSNITELSAISNYSAATNGYILIIPELNSSGDLTINNNTVKLKNYIASDDNASELAVIPVLKNDVITCTCSFTKAYFVPVNVVTIDTDS